MSLVIFLLSNLLLTHINAIEISNNEIKKAITGIVLMGNTDFNKRPNILPNNVDDYNSVKSIWEGLDGVVINVTWSQLEPQEGQYNFTEINNSINFIELHNKLYPNKLWHAKLRVWYGNQLPQWYINQKNFFLIPRIGIFNKPHITVLKEAKYWSNDFIQKTTLLNNALASMYDNNDIIRDVSMTACSSLTDEPFISPFDIISILSEINAGYTNEMYFSCLYNITSIYNAWHSTVLDYSINQFRFITSYSIVIKDILATFSIINHIISLGLPNLRLDNHDLKEPLNINTLEILTYEKQYMPLGGTLQMQGPIYDPELAIPIALSFGISSVELWNKQIVKNSITQLSAWSNDLSKNKV